MTAPTHPTPRPLPPAPWPVKGLTQGAVVLERLVEAVRALELAVWGLRLEQALDAAGMPRALHRIDASPGGAPLACRLDYPEWSITKAEYERRGQLRAEKRVTADPPYSSHGSKVTQ